MSLNVKYLLLAAVFFLSQTWALANASAHDLGADHGGDECQVCLTVQAKDKAPPPVLEWAHIDKFERHFQADALVTHNLDGFSYARPPPRAPPL